MEHSILIAVWHILTNDVEYADLGGDYFGRLDPERAMHRIVRQVNALGFNRALRPDPDRLTTHTTLGTAPATSITPAPRLIHHFRTG